MKYILAIETSCDETSIAVISSEREILSNIILTQHIHSTYGGVVPELASRSHAQHIDAVAKQAIKEANIELSQIDAIAATSGPGLIGGVIVGLSFAKAMAATLEIPFIAVNHLEGHALTVRLSHNTDYPYLLLLVSGGHCQTLNIKGLGDYKLLGQTIDDAIGEAFDKVAKMLGLGYPGGAVVEKMALSGDPKFYNFPKPLLAKHRTNFSLSGLKTAVLRVVEKGDYIAENICASFQRTVGDIIINRLKNIIEDLGNDCPKTLAIAGGVAANKYLYNRINDAFDLQVVCPPMHLCTDNAAMIAYAAMEHFLQGKTSPLTVKPQARWKIYN